MLAPMLRAPFFALPLAAACFSCLVGCNTDAAVFVDPSIAKPKATVSNGVFGPNVSGSFELDLHLGARAADSSSVTLGEFELVTAKDKSPIVSPLPLTANEKFPVTVAQDSDETVGFTFDSGKKPLEAAAKGQLCDSDGVAIKGTIQDSLASSSTPVFSETFDPSGC